MLLSSDSIRLSFSGARISGPHLVSYNKQKQQRRSLKVEDVDLLKMKCRAQNSLEHVYFVRI